MYRADSVVVDAVTLIEDGTILLPREIDWEKHAGQTIFCLPRKSMVVNWVLEQSEKFVMEQQDNNIIKRAEWRKDRFIEMFNKRYNEMSLFEDILKFKKVAGSQQESLHMYRRLSKRVVDQTIDMLEAIKDMTEYDYSFCFKEKEEEEKYDKRNM